MKNMSRTMMKISSSLNLWSRTRPLHITTQSIIGQNIHHKSTLNPITVPLNILNQRCLSTGCITNQLTKTTGTEYLHENKPSLYKKIVKNLGFFFIKSKFNVMGYELYEQVVKDINYLQFFNEFEMEDTFHSWFLIIELHVWLLCVRVMKDEEYGKIVRDGIISSMWLDVEERSKNLTYLKSTIRGEVQILNEEFRAALLNYDEGLQSDDKILAGAVWRRFFCKECDNPLLIEKMVHYIRKQTYTLEQHTNKAIFVDKKLKMISLDEIPKVTG